MNEFKELILDNLQLAFGEMKTIVQEFGLISLDIKIHHTPARDQHSISFELPNAVYCDRCCYVGDETLTNSDGIRTYQLYEVEQILKIDKFHFMKLYDVAFCDFKLTDKLRQLLPKSLRFVPVSPTQNDKLRRISALRFVAGSQISVYFGNMRQNQEKLAQNLSQLLEVIESNIPFGWENVNCLSLSAKLEIERLPALPIYVALPESGHRFEVDDIDYEDALQALQEEMLQ